MSLLRYSVGTIVFLALLSALALSRTPSAADDMGMTSCASFTSMSWVNPMPPSNSGKSYLLTVTGHGMSCAQAQAWAKKLLVQHIAGRPMMMKYPPLKGGPPGYVCTGAPDNTGHAYRGHCLKTKQGNIVSSFDWTNQ